MKVINAPNEIPSETVINTLGTVTYVTPYLVFLAGSIELGAAENWQEKIINILMKSNLDNTYILNPRRLDWDSSWIQDISNSKFKEQVEWELNALELSSKILMYFDASTKSPISLLEFGMYAKTGKLIVCCPEGFWRKGNIDVVCEKYKVKQVNTVEELAKEAFCFVDAYTGKKYYV